MTLPPVDLLSLPQPLDRVRRKMLDHLDGWMSEFVALSPFVLVATVSAEGECTVSPRGGAPGFVRQLDERTLLLPDYSGNRLLESTRNLVSMPSVGLLFMLPGCEQVVRVSGVGDVVQADGDGESNGENAERYFSVNVRRAYYHCGRAVRFAKLWDTEGIASWMAQPRIGRPPAY